MHGSTSESRHHVLATLWRLAVEESRMEQAAAHTLNQVVLVSIVDALVVPVLFI